MRIVLIAAAAVILCVGLGVAALLYWPVYSRNRTQRAAAAKAAAQAKAEAETAAGPAGQEANAILEKVALTYRGLSNFSATGTSVSIIDMSQINPADFPVPVQSPQTGKKGRKLPAAPKAPTIPKTPQTNETEVSVKLAKPDLYRVESIRKFGRTNTMTTALWSSGDGDFMIFDMPRNQRYSKLPNRQAGLGISGSLGGLSTAVAQLFFGETDDLAKVTRNWAKMGEETLNGEDCYILAGRVMGQKLQLWVSKASYLIFQSQIILGGQIDLADPIVQEQMNKANTKGTPQQKAEMETQMKQAAAMATKIRGTVTETYRSIGTNTTLTVDDFKYPVPPDVKLSPTPF